MFILSISHKFLHTEKGVQPQTLLNRKPQKLFYFLLVSVTFLLKNNTTEQKKVQIFFSYMSSCKKDKFEEDVLLCLTYMRLTYTVLCVFEPPLGAAELETSLMFVSVNASSGE